MYSSTQNTQNTSNTGFANNDLRPLDASGNPIDIARPVNMPLAGVRPMDNGAALAGEDPKTAQLAPGGVAWDVPAPDNTTGVVNAHPVDGLHRVSDQPPSQFHHHDFASSGQQHTQDSQPPLLRQDELHSNTSSGLQNQGIQTHQPQQGFQQHQPGTSHLQQQHQQQPLMNQQQQQLPLAMNQLNLNQNPPQQGAIDQSRPAIVIAGLQPQQLQNLGLQQQPLQTQGPIIVQHQQQPMLSQQQQPLMSQQHQNLLEQQQQPLSHQPLELQKQHPHHHQAGALPHYEIGNRWFAYNELQSGADDGHLRWNTFADALGKKDSGANWSKEQAREQWDAIDTDKNGWMTRSDWLRFCNQPGVSNHIQQMEAKLPGGTGLAVSSIAAGATQNLHSTGLDPSSDLHDNTTALTNAGAIYSSNLQLDKDSKPKTSSAFGDRVSQFFNKGSIGNRLFTFLDEEDGTRSGVVSWGQLMPLVTQFGQWDANLAQHAWYNIDTTRTGTMTRGEFIKFSEQEECRVHIQLMEAELTGKADAGKFGKKIPREEFKADPSLLNATTTSDGMQRTTSPAPASASSNQYAQQQQSNFERVPGTSTYEPISTNQQQTQASVPPTSQFDGLKQQPITGPTGLPLSNNQSTGFHGTDVNGNPQLHQPAQIDAFHGAELARD